MTISFAAFDDKIVVMTTIWFSIDVRDDCFNDFLGEQPKTPPLQWNNCLCTLWSYSQSSAALFMCIPSLCQAVILMLKCLSINTEETTFFCPNWSGTKYPEGIYSQDEIRQPCVFFKCNEGVFTTMFPWPVVWTDFNSLRPSDAYLLQ